MYLWFDLYKKYCKRISNSGETDYIVRMDEQIGGQEVMVSFDDEGQLWRIDVEAFRIGSAFLSNTSMAEQARPIRFRLSRNIGVAVCLVAFVGVMFGLSVAKVSTTGPIEGFDHVARPALAEDTQ